MVLPSYTFILPTATTPDSMNVRILQKSNRRIIAGPASVAITDQEGDLITGQALAKALPEFLANNLISLNHMDVRLGSILKEYTDGTNVYKTEVRPVTKADIETYAILRKGGAKEGDIAFFLVAEINQNADPEHYVNKTWQQILEGDLSCFSISGQALGKSKSALKCDGLSCKMVNLIDNMAASAITVCKQGVNQAAGFNIVSKNETSGDDDMDMKFSEARKALLAKGTPEAIKAIAAMDDYLANFLSKAKADDKDDKPKKVEVIEPDEGEKHEGHIEGDKVIAEGEGKPMKPAPPAPLGLDNPTLAAEPALKECGCGKADDKAPEAPVGAVPPGAPDAAPPLSPDVAAPGPAPSDEVPTQHPTEGGNPAEGSDVPADAAVSPTAAGGQVAELTIQAPIEELVAALEEARQLVSQVLAQSASSDLAKLKKQLTGSTFSTELWDGTTDHGRIGYPSQPSGHSTHAASSTEASVKEIKDMMSDLDDANINFQYPSGAKRPKFDATGGGFAEEGDYPQSDKKNMVKKAPGQQHPQANQNSSNYQDKHPYMHAATQIAPHAPGILAGAGHLASKLGPMVEGAAEVAPEAAMMLSMDEKGMAPKPASLPPRPTGQGIPPTAATVPAPTRPIGKDGMQQESGKKTPDEKLQDANDDMGIDLFQKPNADGHTDAHLIVHKMAMELGADRHLAHLVADLVCGKQYFSKCFTCDTITDKYDSPEKVYDSFKKARDYGSVGIGLLSKHDTRVFMDEYKQAIEMADEITKAWQAQRSKRGTLMAVNSENPKAKPLYGEKAARALAAQRRMGGQQQQTLEGGQAQPEAAGLTGSDVASSYLEAAGVGAEDVPKIMQAIGQAGISEVRGQSGLQAAKQAINRALQSAGYAPEGQMSDDMARKLVNASNEAMGTGTMQYEEPTGGGEAAETGLPQPSQQPVPAAPQQPSPQEQAAMQQQEQAKDRAAAEPVSGFQGGDMSGGEQPITPEDSYDDNGPVGIETTIGDIQPNLVSDVGETPFPEGANPEDIAGGAADSYEQQQQAQEAAAMQNPEVQAMQAEQQMAQAELEQDKARHASEMEMDQQRMQHEQQLDQAKLQHEMQLGQQEAAVDMQQAQQQAQVDQQMAQQQMQQDAAMAQTQQQFDMGQQQQQLQGDQALAQQEAAAGNVQSFAGDDGQDVYQPAAELFADAEARRVGEQQQMDADMAAANAATPQQIPVDEFGNAPEELPIDAEAGLNDAAMQDRMETEGMAQQQPPAAPQAQPAPAPAPQPQATPQQPPAQQGGARSSADLAAMAAQRPAAAQAAGAAGPSPTQQPAAPAPTMVPVDEQGQAPAEMGEQTNLPLQDYQAQTEEGKSPWPAARANTKGYWRDVGPQDRQAIQDMVGNMEMAQSLPRDAQHVQVNPNPSSYTTEPVARYIGPDGKPKSIFTREYYEKTADPKKFARVEQNRSVLKSLINQQYGNLARPVDSRERDVALMNLIASETGMRRGNLQSAMAKGTYGVSTMPTNALSFQGNTAVFQFPGKGGVPQTFMVKDPKVVQALQQQVQMARQTGRTELFNTKSIHAYHAMPASAHAKFHDYRTMKGIDVARDAISRMPPPRNEAELANLMKMVSEHVAEALGNTPDVALQSYVDPAVFNESRQQAGVAKAMPGAEMQPQQQTDDYPVTEDDADAMEDRDGSEYEVPAYLQGIWQQAFGGQAPPTMRIPPEVLEETLRQMGAGQLIDSLKGGSQQGNAEETKYSEPQAGYNPSGSA